MTYPECKVETRTRSNRASIPIPHRPYLAISDVKEAGTVRFKVEYREPSCELRVARSHPSGSMACKFAENVEERGIHNYYILLSACGKGGSAAQMEARRSDLSYSGP